MQKYQTRQQLDVVDSSTKGADQLFDRRLSEGQALGYYRNRLLVPALELTFLEAAARQIRHRFRN